MDRRLREIERGLAADGVRYKVLDARAISLMETFFTAELAQSKIKALRAPTDTAKAQAFERMNNLASLMELVLP